MTTSTTRSAASLMERQGQLNGLRELLVRAYSAHESVFGTLPSVAGVTAQTVREAVADAIEVASEQLQWVTGGMRAEQLRARSIPRSRPERRAYGAELGTLLGRFARGIEESARALPNGMMPSNFTVNAIRSEAIDRSLHASKTPTPALESNLEHLASATTIALSVARTSGARRLLPLLIASEEGPGEVTLTPESAMLANLSPYDIDTVRAFGKINPRLFVNAVSMVDGARKSFADSPMPWAHAVADRFADGAVREALVALRGPKGTVLDVAIVVNAVSRDAESMLQVLSTNAQHLDARSSSNLLRYSVDVITAQADQTSLRFDVGMAVEGSQR